MKRKADFAEYVIWRKMKQRCLDKNVPEYKNYGGRGINICKRWLNSFENFISDIGQRPSCKHTLDRIDNNKGYYPKNCRWVNRSIQCNNKRSNHLIKFDGKTLTLSQWSKESSLPYSCLRARMRRGKLSIDKALTSPVGIHLKMIEFNGMRMTITQWSNKTRIPYYTLAKRLKKWSIQDALTKPVRRHGL